MANSKTKQTAYHIFHWKHSSIVPGFFWAEGLAMLGLAVSIEYSELPFILAYISYTIAFIWTLGCWLTSEYLNNKNPKNWIRQRRKRATSAEFNVLYIYQWGVSLLIFIIFLGLLVGTNSIKTQFELSQLHGWLYPSSDPIPPNRCGEIPKDSLAVFLGSSVALTRDFPHTVLTLKDEDIIILDKHDDGSLAISMNVRSEDGRVIAKFEKGEFIINQNNFLEMRRSDRSSLQIIDQHNNEVLNVRYFNPQAISISVMRTYPSVEVIFNSNNCVAYSKKSFRLK